MKPISLDDLRELIGRAIFGADWLGGSSNEDWDLIKGPYGVKQRARPTAAGVYPSHIAPCPRATADKLDRALGRAARCDAQYSTVDSWIEDHGLPVDPKKPADRKIFNAIKRKEFPKATKGEQTKPGRMATVLPRLMDEIERDIAAGKLTIVQLRDATLKALQARYSAKQSSMRDARMRFLATVDPRTKAIPIIPKKNK